MQKTSSNPSHMYKPLPKKERSCLFHLCSPVRRCGVHHRASLFSLWLCIDLFHRLYPQGPRAHLYMSTWGSCCPGLMISYVLYPVLHLSTKRPSPAPWSVLLQVLLSSFYREVNCLQKLFIFFPLFFLFFVPHTAIRWHLEQDSWWC